MNRFGKLDILVNNAGISIQGGLEDFSEADWDRTINVNAKGVFLGTKHSIPEMRRAGGGSIINISSGAGIAPSPGTSAAYAASKGAVRIFSKATAVQYAAENIRCNSVHPGPIDTPMLRASRPMRQDARNRWHGYPWAVSALPKRLPTASCIWPPTNPPSSQGPS